MPQAALCIAAAATAALVSSKCDLPALAMESMLITFICHTASGYLLGVEMWCA